MELFSIWSLAPRLLSSSLERIAMYRDLIVMLLIAVFAGLGAVAVLRAFWKTKRLRRNIPNSVTLGGKR
jgi:H+/Cl- antiporter ClcA